MNTYEAYVRISCNGLIIKTLVMAENSQQAYYLLQGQYGEHNIIHSPMEVK